MGNELGNNPNHLLSMASLSNANDGRCPTVRVKHLETDAECLINKADYNAELHELVDAPPARKRAKLKDEAGKDEE